MGDGITDAQAVLPSVPATLAKVNFLHIVGGIVGGFVVVIGGAVISAQGDSGTASLVVLIAGLGLMIWGGVRAFQCLYRAWSIIPADRRRTTPGKAVGFCFIPIFNYYWFFIAYFGWAKDYNEFLDASGQQDAARVPAELFRAYGILIIVTVAIGFVPALALVGNLMGLGAMVVGLMALKHMCDAVSNAVDTRPADNNLLN